MHVCEFILTKCFYFCVHESFVKNNNVKLCVEEDFMLRTVLGYRQLKYLVAALRYCVFVFSFDVRNVHL